MMPAELENVVIWWGPGILLLMAFGYGLMRLAHYWIEKSLDFKRQQMESAVSLAQQYVEQFLRAQKSQADALSRLATSIEQRDSMEAFEHQEMLIALKALHGDLGALPCHRERAAK